MRIAVKFRGMYLQGFEPNEQYQDSLVGIQTERYSGAEFDPVFSKEENWFDPITGHLPCWVKCDRNNPSDKWFWSAYDNALSLIKRRLSDLDFLSDSIRLSDNTYEAVGEHFQGNPHNLNSDCLAHHGAIKVKVERSFKGIKKFLAENYIEGIVFWLNGEPVCKIKRYDFGYEWNSK